MAAGSWQMWVGSVGGLLAVVSQFWATGVEWFLPLIGGVLALVALWVK